ncbi:MAG TPA: hypothetical protein VFG33_04590 [Kribbella sp.]|uniref:hypothetical protein n=1 Tax=Kribbella sp. TaxID=1871183 RepID=UPI002D77BF1C|nr:hypothetical protein [Kribbella sp.]HET6292622.1 hypothetical protein [Kribbella sp.]
MSSVEDAPGEVARRHRQVQLVVSLIYLGIPLVFLALVLWISSRVSPFNWQAGLLPLALLVLGWFLRGKHRYKPQRWAGAGGWFGAITGVFTAFYSIVLDINWLATLFLPAALLGAILGIGLARYAVRVLLDPLIPELADTPYELIFRLRGLRLTTLGIGTTAVTIRGPVLLRTKSGQTPEDLARTYQLSEISGVHDVTLSGAERLKYPISLPFPPIGTAGPAVILQARGEDWVLPTDHGPVITQILNRRKAA